MVAWTLCGTIPWGTLLRQRQGWVALYSEGRFRWVQLDGEWSYKPSTWGTGGLLDEGARWDLLAGEVTIIALNVPTDATADDLRTLAEVFEVREATRPWESRDWAALFGYLNPPDTLFDRLHAAGWRPGMTAEDAARLLAEQEAACRQ